MTIPMSLCRIASPFTTRGEARRWIATGRNSCSGRSVRQLILVALLAACVPLAAAQSVSRIRVMLHPYSAAPGQLPDATLSLLQSVAGVPLTLAGTTRTGALEFSLAQPLDAAASAAMLQRLRNDRNILWVDTVTAAPVSARIQSSTDTTAAPDGRKVMLKTDGHRRARLGDHPAAHLGHCRRAAGGRPPDRRRLGPHSWQHGFRCPSCAGGRVTPDRPCGPVRRSGSPCVPGSGAQ